MKNVQRAPGDPSGRIGIIADTHGLLRETAISLLDGCDLIVHAGDVGKPEVLERLATIAPLIAIRGNVDKADWASTLPDTEMFSSHERWFYVLHNLGTLDIDPEAAGIDCVISGHSHQPRIFCKGTVLYINPGSAGPRRFKLPTTVATVAINCAPMTAELHQVAI